ncbi:aldehyde ferredoxin oxidoreductase [Sulfolobales archaeon HS-7]|nr:aldehyde ferredoxin oxidoreductase [Sulfolobales archaeon HS-7]
MNNAFKGGFTGKIAEVNLNSGEVDLVDLNLDDVYNFLGGRGLGTKLLSDYRNRSNEPFFGMLVGPLTGTGIPLANRLTFVFHSPLTNTIAYANTGGYAGTSLKKTGVDGIILKGISPKPIYLFIKKGKISVEDASPIWGKCASETLAYLRQRHGDVRVISIGPAGERLVRFANVVNDAGRSSGVRHGAGYVLGKMKVKAVAILGDYSVPVEVADKGKFKDVLTRLTTKIRNSPLLNRETGSFSIYGTPLAVEPLFLNEALPVKNYTYTSMENALNLSGKTMSQTILVGRLTCTACSVQCRRDTATYKKYKFRVEGPDYAQISSLGSNCYVDDVEAVAYMNYLSYEWGMDPIEVGNILAALADATEKGYVEESYGLRWGDSDRMIEIIQKVANREGKYWILGEGISAFLTEINVPELDTSVMGITMQNTDPRVEPAWGLLNATENTGSSCHIWVYPDLIYSFKGLNGIRSLLPDDYDVRTISKAVKFKQDLVAVLDSLQVCAFSYMAFEMKDYVDALNAVVGWEVTEDELLKIGERIFNAERIYNIKFGSKRDYLPRKFTEVPVPEGKHKGGTCKLDDMLPVYYAYRGWKNGIPSEDKLKELGLS